MGLLLTFGPLQQVPSAILNGIQRMCLDHRGTGPGNTLAAGISADNSGKNGGHVQVSVDFPLTAVPLEIDSRIDWRDRRIQVNWAFDPVRDIRPGEVSDHVFARDSGIVGIYTTTGNRRWALSPDMTIFIGPTGVLFVEKANGYGYIELRASVQLKERS